MGYGAAQCTSKSETRVKIKPFGFLLDGTLGGCSRRDSSHCESGIKRVRSDTRPVVMVTETKID